MVKLSSRLICNLELELKFRRIHRLALILTTKHLSLKVSRILIRFCEKLNATEFSALLDSFYHCRKTIRVILFFAGTPEQIKICRQLIQEKVDANGGMSGGHMGGGPPQQTPPPGNFMSQQVKIEKQRLVIKPSKGMLCNITDQNEAMDL